MAFGCIFVSNFMVQAVVRADPALRGRAIAIIEGAAPVWSVVGLNEAASQAGIAMGMTKSQVQQFCEIEIRHRSRTQEKAAHAALLDLGWSVSPRVEDTTADTVVVDLAGLNSLFGSDEKIARQLAERALSLGLATQIATASTIDVAILAARGFSGITVIPEGEEQRFLASLPVDVLAPSPEVLETLDRWGVHTCGALAALPVLQLSERLGQEGVRLHELAEARSEPSSLLSQQAVHFEEEMELEDAVEELEPLAFLLGRLLDQLCARLAARALAACAVRVKFELERSFEEELRDLEGISRRSGTPRDHSGDTRHSAAPARPTGGLRVGLITVAAPRLKRASDAKTSEDRRDKPAPQNRGRKPAGETPPSTTTGQAAPQEVASGAKAHLISAGPLAAGLKPRPSDSKNAGKMPLDCARDKPALQERPKIYERVLTLPVPVRDSKMLLKLVRLHLQGDAPSAPILKIMLAAEAARPRVAQGGLFLPSAPDPEKLELTLARLANLVGDDHVGSPELIDTHRPGEFRMRRFVPPRDATESRGSKGRAAGTGNGKGAAAVESRGENAAAAQSGEESESGCATRIAFRVFRPALPARVELRGGCPARVEFPGKCGRVVAASGPWRSSGDWWQEDGWHNDEWDLELDFGSAQENPRRGFYRIFYDALRKEWFVRGAYD